MLCWHLLDQKIDDSEMHLLFREWLKSRDVQSEHKDFLNADIVHRQDSSLWSFLDLVTSRIAYSLLGPLVNSMLDTVNQVYNSLLAESLEEEGLFSPEKTQQTLAYLETLYLLFDSSGVGYMRLSGIVLLFQFLRLNKIVSVKFQQFLHDATGYTAKMTLRQFKRYFLRQRIA